MTVGKNDSNVNIAWWPRDYLLGIFQLYIICLVGCLLSHHCPLVEDVPDMLTQKVGNHFSFHDMATHNYFVHKNFIKIDGINCSYK